MIEFNELAAGTFTATVLAPNGVDPLPASQITAFTITLYDSETGTIINSRDSQNILNANDVTIDEDGHLTWLIQAEDNIIVDDHLETEDHIVDLFWTFDGGSGSASYTLTITNLERIPGDDEACQFGIIITPEVSTTYGKSLPGRMQSVKLTVGQTATLRWTMRDSQGLPLDLTTIGFRSSNSESSSSASTDTCEPLLRFRMRETADFSGADSWELIPSVYDAENGIVDLKMTADTVASFGIYYGEIAALTQGDTPAIIVSNVFYVVINRGQWYGGESNPINGPPSIPEIRLFLRDSAPEESRLLDECMFDDAEIAAAITYPIMYWNEITPQIDGMATTDNFPYRWHWMQAICGHLFLMAAEWYRKNNVTYTAGGISLDDMNKERNYEAAGRARLDEWKQFAKGKKVSLNINGGFLTLESGYDYSIW